MSDVPSVPEMLHTVERLRQMYQDIPSYVRINPEAWREIRRTAEPDMGPTDPVAFGGIPVVEDEKVPVDSYELVFRRSVPRRATPQKINDGNEPSEGGTR